MPYELKRNRVLSLISRRQQYLFTLKPITREMWLRYFDGVVYEQEVVDGAIVSTNDHQGARLQLLAEALVDVQGYGGELPADWRDKLPINHRIAIADRLFELKDGATILAWPMQLGSERVSLTALYGYAEGEETGDGTDPTTYAGLVHNFSVPTVAQSRRYSRDRSRSRVVGGRGGKTQFLGAQKTLVELYDEMIESVAGYTVDGTPLTDDRDLIRLHMDTLHKQQAAFLLFNPQDDE